MIQPLVLDSDRRKPDLNIINIKSVVICLTHPVAMIGSEYLETQRTITVPTAMLCAARSIHHSPLPHREKLLLSTERAGTCTINSVI